MTNDQAPMSRLPHLEVFSFETHLSISFYLVPNTVISTNPICLWVIFLILFICYLPLSQSPCASLPKEFTKLIISVETSLANEFLLSSPPPLFFSVALCNIGCWHWQLRWCSCTQVSPRSGSFASWPQTGFPFYRLMETRFQLLQLGGRHLWHCVGACHRARSQLEEYIW